MNLKKLVKSVPSSVKVAHNGISPQVVMIIALNDDMSDVQLGLGKF